MASDTSRPGISQRELREKLSAWDAKFNPKAPLTDNQRDCFMNLTTCAASRPLPIELPLDESPSLIPLSTTLVTASQEDHSSLLTDLGADKIENAQQFYSWYAKLEEVMENEDEVDYRCVIDQLLDYRSQCHQVLEEIYSAMDYLGQLNKQHVFVSTKTNALHEACEHLLTEQTKLVNTAESINNKLSYFNELERISSKLGSPTLTVTSESFIPMLSRIDECIAYVMSNPQYKESEVYLTRFKHCLSKALNLIKLHVVQILQNATLQVTPRKDVTSPTDAFTLFYGKFRTNAPRVKSLMEQIEQRLDKSSEYGQLLTDCHQCYFSQRMSLLGPSVTEAVSELAKKHIRDHCALMRSGCAFMVHVCEDEYQLFFNFFSQETHLLDAMLEGMCNTLYDVFRPLIIHINHLETLAELCSILKVEMLEEHVQNNPQQLGAFETVCRQILEDVQERLVYRTYIYIRSDILNYKPASGDLAYPEKLEMMESIAESLRKDKQALNRSLSSSSETSQEVAQINTSPNGVDPMQASATEDQKKTIDRQDSFLSGTSMPMSPADLHGMWYPTVRRTLVCLSKLSRCIDTTTFQGLSQEVLSMCIHSLLNASSAITKRKAGVDGQLFLIKHLLILREQIAPFHVNFAIRETSLDFSKIKDAAYGLINHRANLFRLNSTNALLQFLLEGTPHVTEYQVDSKKDVDNQLKKTCEEFISTLSQSAVGTLNDFLTKAEVITCMNKEEGAHRVQLSKQPFASSEKVHDVVAETYRNVKTKIPGIQRSMSLYLANRDTEYILFKPIKMNVQQKFQQLAELVKANYSEEDQQIIACPSFEQVNLLLSSHSSGGVLKT